LKKYEALFILSNSISDDQLDGKIEQISSEIVKLGGAVQAATRMGRITFARPLANKEAGIYVQILFMSDPAKIAALHERYRHNEDLIRIQVTVAKSAAAGATPAAVKKENKAN
jgi:ribosomal protein S6